MLSVYLKKPRTQEQYDSSPAGPHLEAFLLWLEERGYPPRRIRHRLRGVHDFAQWAQDAGLPIQAFDVNTLEAFRQHLHARQRLHYPSGRHSHLFMGARHFVTFLATRMVKIFELAFPLEITLLPSPALRLVFRSTFTHTLRQYGRPWLREGMMDWKQLLAYITGTVDQELLLRNEYLVAENRILRNQINGRVRLSDGERKTLAAIGKQLGRQALAEVASLVTPDTILAWHRKLVAQKFNGSQQRKTLGRPKIDAELEALVVRLARENRSWGYDRIVGALANLGYPVSDQTVGNILKRHGIAPAPERQTTTTWKEFIRTHMDVLVATDFFTAEVWTLGGLVTYYVLFFIHLGSRKVHLAGMTPHPHEAWMMQIARNLTMERWGFLSPGQYLIHDREGKYCPAFQQLIDTAGVMRVPLPPRSPNLNAYAERWVRSVKQECLSQLILFGEASLRHALTQYVEHFHHERNHQGKGNMLLFPAVSPAPEREGSLQCRERLGGLLKYYACEAA